MAKPKAIKKRRILLRIEGCPYCKRAEEELVKTGVTFEKMDIDPDDRTIVEKLSGQSTVPILVEVVGCETQDDEIVDYAHSVR